MKKEIYNIVFASQYEGLSTKEATSKLLCLFSVVFSEAEGLDLLIKLLEDNMCSHEGDRLINKLLKSKT